MPEEPESYSVKSVQSVAKKSGLLLRLSHPQTAAAIELASHPTAESLKVVVVQSA